MALYFTDFSEYTAEAAPSDWTPRFVTSGVTYTVENDGGATGGKVLRAVRASASGRSLLSWDAIDGDANRANLEILTRLRTSATDVSALVGGVIGRASGSAASENAYAGIPIRNSSSVGQRQIGKYVSGTFTSISLDNSSWSANTFYWSRFRINGTTLQIKRWAGDVGDEPGSWQATETDSSLSAAGWIGALIFSVTTIEWDVLGVGTNGDTAPSEPIGGASLQRARIDPVTVTDSSAQASIIKRTIRRTL